MGAAETRGGWLTLCVCAAGIYGAYLTQGLVQEDLSTRRRATARAVVTTCAAPDATAMRRYGAEQERFTHIVFLNLAQSVVCLLWAGLWLLAAPPAKGSAPCGVFWRAAVSNTVGPAFGVRALKNIRHVARLPRLTVRAR